MMVEIDKQGALTNSVTLPPRALALKGMQPAPPGKAGGLPFSKHNLPKLKCPGLKRVVHSRKYLATVLFPN
jgi:hypothetical protein